MTTRDLIQLMHDIDTVTSFIGGCVREAEEIYTLRLRDAGEEILFTIQRGKYDVPIEEIKKIDENTLRTIYAGIASRFSRCLEIGSTMEFRDGGITWNLAPVIGNNTLVELISDNPLDQEWFYEELTERTKQKGLN